MHAVAGVSADGRITYSLYERARRRMNGIIQMTRKRTGDADVAENFFDSVLLASQLGQRASTIPIPIRNVSRATPAARPYTG